MFLEKKVHNFQRVDEYTLDEIKDSCMWDFWHKITEGVRKHKFFEYGTHNYRVFDSQFGENISYNSKNLIFSKMHNDIRGILEQRHFDCRSCMQYETSDESKSDILPPLTKDEFTALFGKGEFPFMIIDVIRVGNHDYSYYTITR